MKAYSIIQVDEWFRISLVLLVIALSFQVNAQKTMTTEVVISGQPSPFVADWILRGQNQMVITVTSTEAADKKIYFTGKLTGDNGISGKTRETQPARSQTQPPGPRTYTGADLNGMFVWEDFESTGASVDAVSRTGLIPEGNYTFCIYVRDYITNEDLTDEASIRCATFSIVYPQPPIPISPECESRIRILQGQPVLFSWMPSAGSPPATQYRLRIVEIFGERSANDALQSATTPPIFDKTFSGNSFLLNPIQLVTPKQSGTIRFAWTVTAIDPTKKILFSNRGESEACSFEYSDQDIQAFLTDLRKVTGPDSALASCDAIEQKLDEKTRELDKLKADIGNIDQSIEAKQADLDRSNKTLTDLLNDFRAKQKVLDDLNVTVSTGQAISTGTREQQLQAQSNADNARTSWETQNKQVSDFTAELNALDAKKEAIRSGEDELSSVRRELEECRKSSAAGSKKVKDEAGKPKSVETASAAGLASFAGKGSDKVRDGTPCDDPGKDLVVEKIREVSPYYIDEIQVSNCNAGSQKKVFGKVEPMPSASKMAEQISREVILHSAATADLHIIRTWQLAEYQWKCSKGKWIRVSRVVKEQGTVDYGWFPVRNKETNGNCWMNSGTNSKVLETKIAKAIEWQMDDCK